MERFYFKSNFTYSFAIVCRINSTVKNNWWTEFWGSADEFNPVFAWECLCNCIALLNRVSEDWIDNLKEAEKF